ncbi:MAG TPA: BatA domain-containing protein [Planctomycetaceae bacterium]|nr:BatA domain-containing protein [Planctomycetaceae bacterium]
MSDPALSFVPLLAFGFESPLLLWGAALSAAPIVIHLLTRRHYRQTSWAAMRFLLEAVRKNSRRLRIEQLILLAVRAAILALLAFALAEPLVENLGAFFQPRQPRHKIIVIDASLSMGLMSREESLFERAKQTAREIVAQGQQGDVFNLVRLSNIPPAVIVPTPAYQTTKVIEEIEQMQLPHGRADLAASMKKIEDLLKLAPEVPHKEVYFISDFQRTSWSAGTNDEAALVRGLFKKIDELGNVILFDLGQNDAANVAVTSFEGADPFVTIARAARFKATVRNFGPERVTGRLLEFLVDDKLVEQRAVDLNPGGEIVEEFAAQFSYGGEHRVLVRLQKDALPLDDQRWLAVPVKDRIRVLCVSGANSARSSGRATDYLELALSPAEAGRGGSASAGPVAGRAGAGPPARSQIEPTVINEGELQSFELAAYDCVFFCNVRMFTDREAQAVETYLKGGGGVVWCLGDRALAENYNLVLYRQGEGCLPAKLGDRQGDADHPETVFAFDPGEFAHPIVGAFSGNPDAGLESTQTYAYVKAIVPSEGRSHVALAFDSGDPAIVESSFGRGKSILITTSVDERWGSWPLWPSFLPLVHEIVQFAVSGRWADRQSLVGEPLTEIFPAAAVDFDIAVGRPDGQTHAARIAHADSVSQFIYENTSESGVYEVSFAHPVARSELFAVNVDPRESNLAKYVQDEIAEDLLTGAEFTYLTSWPGEESEPAEHPAERGGLTRWLVYVLLYLVFAEQVLAWDFRKGLWLICPVAPPIFWLAQQVRRSPTTAHMGNL